MLNIKRLQLILLLVYQVILKLLSHL